MKPKCKDTETARSLIAQMKGEVAGRKPSTYRDPQSPRYDVPEAGKKWDRVQPRQDRGEGPGVQSPRVVFVRNDQVPYSPEALRVTNTPPGGFIQIEPPVSRAVASEIAKQIARGIEEFFRQRRA